MSSKGSVIINGRAYDRSTGLPIEKNDAAQTVPKKSVVNHPSSKKPTNFMQDIMPAGHSHTIKLPKTVKKQVSVQSESSPSSSLPRKPQTARSIHAKPQRSQTLHRAAIKKPVPSTPPMKQNARPKQHVMKSAHISKFAPHPQIRQTTQKSVKPDQIETSKTVAHTENIAPTQHRATAAAAAVHKTTAPISSRAIKEQLISEQMKRIHDQPARPALKAPKKMRLLTSRVSSTLVACLALVLLGGYLTYLNMPSLSIKVAASNAGINASYPTYQPDGYSFNGPVSYSDGEVAIKFKANTSSQEYVVTQKASNWDSQAVLDNYVIDKSNDRYTTYSAQGLTIYMYDGEAAWVNAGILHTVDYDDATLSPTQVERIATSM